MKRRETPRRFVDPGPAPWPHPGPAAVPVGRPAVAHHQRQPQCAVVGVLLPAAVAVELLGAGHLGRDIACRSRAVLPLIFALVFAGHPFTEAVARHRDAHAAQQRVAAAALAVELHALAGADLHAFGLRHPQFAQPAASLRGVSAAVDAVVPGSLRQQAGFSRDDFGLFSRLAGAQAQRHTAAVQLEDKLLVVQPQHLDLGVVRQAQHAGTHAQFGATAAGGADAVARGQRAIALRFSPFTGGAVPPGNAAVEVCEPTHAAGRVFLGAG